MQLELHCGRTVQFKVTIANYQYLFDTRDFTNVCGYT